jgi:predicted nucleic acid-binding protein
MREHEKAKTIELIDSLNIVDVTREIAEKAGEYKRQEKGHILELADCIIASTAFIKKVILVTGNEKHYPMRDIKKIVVKM